RWACRTKARLAWGIAQGRWSQRAVRGVCASLERGRPSPTSAAACSADATLASGVPSQARTLSRTAPAATSTQRTVASGDGVARGVVTTFERARGRKRPPGVARPISTQNEAAGRPTFKLLVVRGGETRGRGIGSLSK